ncbi:MAG: PLP-dependent transferase [Geodermatophilaceae bacterium]|nr:PLP-dependent transferase [Geodermatophilaceae bacterium]
MRPPATRGSTPASHSNSRSSSRRCCVAERSSASVAGQVVDPVVDLRSDTVTQPTPAMRQAMAEAEVGDDVYAEDPTVNALEAEVAALFGHEAALFVPTGTMGNQISLRLLAEPGQEILCDSDAHIVTYEMGAAAALFGLGTRTVPGPNGRFEIDDYVHQVRAPDWHTVRTAVIAVENTHNRGGGSIQPFDRLKALRAYADEVDVSLHCDGARIWNAHVATGTGLAEYGAVFDTLSVCLSKGLGAPVGSVIVSSSERIAAARILRKRLGGGMRQAGILAAAGRHAIAHHLDRLAEDHARARRLAAALTGHARADPETNIVVLDVDGNAHQVAAAARQDGVLVSVVSPTRIRLLTHLDIADEQVDRAEAVLSEILGRETT